MVSIFKIPADDPELILSQYHAMTGQIPLLYLILLLNTVAVAATHFDAAPVILTLFLPVLFGGLSIIRGIAWFRMRGAMVSHAVALRGLRVTTCAAPAISGIFLVWALCLYPYGDAFMKGHVEFYIAITVIGCIFCLMHLRPAAFLVILVVIPPFTLFFMLTGQAVLIAIAINLLLVSICIIMILMRNYRDFISLSDSRKELIARQIETQRLSDENFRLANIDTLTGLFNRRGFFHDLDLALERHQEAHETPMKVTVGLIDLDGFKSINDIFGHATGDTVLQEVGRRIAGLSIPGISFARLGGDEFGFIMMDRPDIENLDFAESLCLLLRAPYMLPGITAAISASVGMAVFPGAGRTAEELFERADYALYHAKQNRRGRPVVFSHEHQIEIRDAARLEQALRRADLEAELSLAFQPIFDFDAGRTTGFECLARWTSPELGRVDPAVFIKSAERSDIINRLTEVLLRKALDAAKQWPENIRVSFNLSIRDIASEDAVRRIGEIVMAGGVRPGRIDFEITETAMMQDFNQARLALLALRQLGVGIALDDFGTGYSSLSYVHRLPLDRIKVDRSFTADVDADPACLNIVKTILDLCRNLKLACVVEGMETAAQVGVLRDVGCSLMQGYFFAEPMVAGDLPGFLDAEARRFNPATGFRGARIALVPAA